MATDETKAQSQKQSMPLDSAFLNINLTQKAILRNFSVANVHAIETQLA